MKKVSGFSSFAFLTASLAAFATIASATPVAITNPSFETLPPGGLTFSCGTGCSYSNGVIPGWATVGPSGTGEFQPGSAQFTTIPDGITIAYNNGGSISQSVGTVSGAGILYTLTAAIGIRSDIPGSSLGTLQLLIGSTAVNGSGSTPTPGNFSTFTATYTSTAADVGKTITIQLTAPRHSGRFR